MTKTVAASLRVMALACASGSIIIILLIETQCGLANTTFWMGFEANLIATLVGLICGIPIALTIRQKQQRTIDRATERQTELRATDLERRVTRVLLDEFRQNETQAGRWREQLSRDARLPVGFFTERWEVLKESGDLASVSDLDLVSHFARCHELYGVFNILLEHLMDIVWFPGLVVGLADGTSNRDDRREEVVKTMLNLLGDVDAAHDGLADRLNAGASDKTGRSARRAVPHGSERHATSLR